MEQAANGATPIPMLCWDNTTLLPTDRQIVTQSVANSSLLRSVRVGLLCFGLFAVVPLFIGRDG